MREAYTCQACGRVYGSDRKPHGYCEPCEAWITGELTTRERDELNRASDEQRGEVLHEV